MDKTFLCNCKVKFIRPKYQNLKDCLEDDDNIYIGRGGIVFVDNERYPKKDSVWANPYKVDKDGDLDEVLKLYKKYIKNKIKKENLNISELLNKNLYGLEPTKYNKNDKKICHGQVLLKLLKKSLKI